MICLLLFLMWAGLACLFYIYIYSKKLYFLANSYLFSRELCRHSGLHEELGLIRRNVTPITQMLHLNTNIAGLRHILRCY